MTNAIMKYITIKAIDIKGNINLAKPMNLVSYFPYMFLELCTLTRELRSIISSLMTSAVKTKKGIINPNINQ